jgi:hypothetical protein
MAYHLVLAGRRHGRRRRYRACRRRQRVVVEELWGRQAATSENTETKGVGSPLRGCLEGARGRVVEACID